MTALQGKYSVSAARLDPHSSDEHIPAGSPLPLDLELSGFSEGSSHRIAFMTEWKTAPKMLALYYCFNHDRTLFSLETASFGHPSNAINKLIAEIWADVDNVIKPDWEGNRSRQLVNKAPALSKLSKRRCRVRILSRRCDVTVFPDLSNYPL